MACSYISASLSRTHIRRHKDRAQNNATTNKPHSLQASLRLRLVDEQFRTGIDSSQQAVNIASKEAPNPPFAPQHILVTGGAGSSTSFVHEGGAPSAGPYDCLDALTYAGKRESRCADREPQTLYCMAIFAMPTCGIPVSEQTNLSNLVPPVAPLLHFAAESRNDSILDASPFLNTNVTGTYVLLE